MRKKISMIVLVILIVLNIPIANAEYDKQEEKLLTYEEAVQRALNYSYPYKNQLEEIEKLKILRSEAGDNLGGSYPTSYGNGEDDASRLSKLKKLQSAIINLEMAKKQAEIMKKQISFEVRNIINEIHTQLKEKELMNLELKNAQIKLDMAIAKERKGLLSRYDLQKEQDTYNKLIKEKELLEKSIETSYTQLNSLIGCDESESYRLEDDTVAYEPLEENDIDHLILKIIHESSSIWNQEKKIEMAELDLNLYVFNAGADPYEVKKIDLRQEKYNLGNLKNSLEESIRTMYYQIQQLEKNYELLEEKLKSAQRELAFVHAQYKVGVATNIQLQEAELAVAQIKHEILKKTMEHEKVKEILYNPDLKGI